MKKLSFTLALLLLLTVIFACLPASAAAPIESYTRVEKPAESTIRRTNNRYQRVWGLENPVGEWNPMAYQDGGMGPGTTWWEFKNNATYVDCNYSCFILPYNDYEKHTLTEIVFADAFTYGGQGSFGKTRVTPETWEKVTVVVSDDYQNWRKVNFTVAYHTESYSTMIDSYGQEYPVDLYWHLILEEATTAKYFAIHVNEPKAWDAQNHSPRLGIILANDYFYGVNTSGYEAGLGDVRYLYINEEEVQGEILNVTFDENGGLTNDGVRNYTAGFTLYTFDGSTRFCPYVGYKTTVWANEIVIADLSHWDSLPLYTDYEDLEIYYADDLNGPWKKVNTTVTSYNCNQELQGTFAQGIRFVFDELVSGKYFMVFDPAPNAIELRFSGGTMNAVYEPANGTDAPPPPPETEPPVETPAPDTPPPATEAPVTESTVTTEADATTAPTSGDDTTAPYLTVDEYAPSGWPYIILVVVCGIVTTVIVLIRNKKRT